MNLPDETTPADDAAESEATDAEATSVDTTDASTDVTIEATPADPLKASGEAPAAKTNKRPMAQAACLALLAEHFPALFTGPMRPLKLRIQSDIQERVPGVFTKADLSAFFRRYTGATAYLQAVSKSAQRFDLDGQPAGELTDEHRQVAKDELTRRRQLQQTKREEENAERNQRAQLLRDFETTRLTEANFCALKGIAAADLPALLELAKQEARERPPAPRFNDRQDRPDHRQRRPQGEPRRHQGNGPSGSGDGRRPEGGPPGSRGPRGPRNGG